MSEQKNYDDYRDEVLLDLLMDEIFSEAYINKYDSSPRLHFQITAVGEKIISLMRPQRCENKLKELLAERDAEKEGAV